MDIEDSLEQLNNYNDFTDNFKKRKFVVLKDNNKVPDYKVRKVMNSKMRYQANQNHKYTRNQ